MSDWSMCELDDIVWDVFNDGCDRVVPHHGVDQLHDSKVQSDSQKKARHDSVDCIERNSSNCDFTDRDTEEAGECSLLTKGNPHRERSLSHASQNAAFPVSFASTCTGKESTSGNTGATESFFYGLKDPNVSATEDTSAADKNSTRQISASISPADSELEFLINEPKTAENGHILDYEWPDIGNFEDVDQMFSNGYSHLGQGSTGMGNELSWFSSSSYAIDGSEEGLQSGFQPSYSDISALRTPLERNPTKVVNWSENGETPVRSTKSSHLSYGSYSWLYTDVQGEEGCTVDIMFDTFHGTNGSKSYIQTACMNDNSMSSSEGSNSVSKLRDVKKSMLPKSEGRKKVQHSDYAGGQFYTAVPLVQSTESTQDHHSSVSLQPSRIVRADTSSSLHLCDSQLEAVNTQSSREASAKFRKDISKAGQVSKVFYLNNHIAALSSGSGQVHHQRMEETPTLLMESPSADEQKAEVNHIALQLHGKLAVDAENATSQTLFSSKILSQEKLIKTEKQVENDSALEDVCRNPLQSESNHSFMQENLGLWSGNILPGPTSLRELQDVLDGLDLRIKLCIRDGLYRLARNAQQRHVDGTISGCKASNQSIGIGGARRCPGFVDVETGTNPIDRSIAHLLFYRAELTPSPTNNALSLFDSRVASEQNIASTSPDALMIPHQPTSCKEESTGSLMDR